LAWTPHGTNDASLTLREGGEFTDSVYIIREGEKYLFVKAYCCLKCFEDGHFDPTRADNSNGQQRCRNSQSNLFLKAARGFDKKNHCAFGEMIDQCPDPSFVIFETPGTIVVLEGQIKMRFGDIHTSKDLTI
jgi:hypothetical protein